MHKLLARLGECVCKLLTLRMKEEASLYPLKTVEGPKKATATIYILHTQFDV